MNLNPGEAAVLIIRRDESDPKNYFIGVRKSESCFDPQSHDFQLQGGQTSILEPSHGLDYKAALEEATPKSRRFNCIL